VSDARVALARLLLAAAAVFLAPAAASAGPALADPTRPPAAPAAREDAAAPEPAWSLEAIWSQDGRRVAVIDGRRLREGDAFQGARVMRIDRSAVRLDGPEGPTTLRLFGEPVKTESARGEERP
jgi:hypothetical protein